MTESDAQRPQGRLTLLAIAAVFFGPMLFAMWLYFSGSGLAPEGRTNHGALLEPLVSVDEQLPDSPLVPAREGSWQMVYTYRATCGEGCRFALYTLRQSRLMLGREMDRVQRVFLHGDEPLDTLFLAAEHKGLITLNDATSSEFLTARVPDELAAGGFYLIDPLGNLVMYFPPDIDPGDMVDDIKRLLKLSRIG